MRPVQPAPMTRTFRFPIPRSCSRWMTRNEQKRLTIVIILMSTKESSVTVTDRRDSPSARTPAATGAGRRYPRRHPRWSRAEEEQDQYDEEGDHARLRDGLVLLHVEQALARCRAEGVKAHQANCTRDREHLSVQLEGVYSPRRRPQGTLESTTPGHTRSRRPRGPRGLDREDERLEVPPDERACGGQLELCAGGWMGNMVRPRARIRAGIGARAPPEGGERGPGIVVSAAAPRDSEPGCPLRWQP